MRGKSLICRDFLVYPRFVWITLWMKLGRQRQALDSSGLPLDCPIFQQAGFLMESTS
jgi:hypothetical protein